MRNISMAAVAVTALVANGAQARSRDPGPPDQRQVMPGNFDRVAVAGPFVVRIHTGQATSVSLSGPRTMLDDTDLFIRDGQLVIGWQEGAGWSRNGNLGVDVDITVPVIRGAMNLGAGSIDIDRVQTDHFTASLASSGGITIHAMDVNELKAELAGAGSLGLAQIEAKGVDVDLAGSGTMRATGRAGTANLRLASSGSFDNPGFTARDANIVSAGSGAIRAIVTNAADIKSLGSGGIVLTGGAKCTVSKMGSGNVNCS